MSLARFLHTSYLELTCQPLSRLARLLKRANSLASRIHEESAR